MVGSEKDPHTPAKYVYVQSLRGGTVRLINPWPGKPVTVEQLAPTRCAIELANTDPTTLEFPTIEGAAYDIRPRDASAPSAKSLFTSAPNSAPKSYHEAVLGKFRDF